MQENYTLLNENKYCIKLHFIIMLAVIIVIFKLYMLPADTSCPFPGTQGGCTGGSDRLFYPCTV